LHGRGQHQILLQRAALLAAQMIDAETDQRITGQTIRLNGVVAVLADAERTGVNAFERRIHFFQQRRQMRIGWPVIENGGEFFASIQ
jgi:hypothetical protein